MRYVLPHEWENFRFFKEHEFFCKCGKCRYSKEAYVSYDLVAMLDEARYIAETKFIIQSGQRCEAHNTKEGGTANSDHLVDIEKGKICTGVDIKVNDDVIRYQVDVSLHILEFKKVGVYKNHYHVGLGEPNTPSIKWVK